MGERRVGGVGLGLCEEEVRWAWVLVVQAAPSRAIPFAPSMPLGRRTRWSGTLAALVSALQVEMPNEIMYEDTVNPRALVLHTPRWRRLKELQPNMAFKRSDVRKALQETARLAEWPLSQADKDEFADVVTDRLMVMLRHISQAGLRGHPPRWYREIFTTGREEVDVEKMSSPSEEEEQEDRGAEEAEEEEAVDNASDFEPLVGQKLDLDRFFEAPRKKPAKASSAAPEWCYGYSPQLEKAWRCCAETPLTKAFTAQFEAGATPLAPVLAVWPDGDRHEVMELTTAAFQARGEAVKAAAKGGAAARRRPHPRRLPHRGEGPLGGTTSATPRVLVLVGEARLPGLPARGTPRRSGEDLGDVGQEARDGRDREEGLVQREGHAVGKAVRAHWRAEEADEAQSGEGEPRRSLCEGGCEWQAGRGGVDRSDGPCACREEACGEEANAEPVASYARRGHVV